jgi:O-antigen/teichoic acid export membrane protein
LVGTVTTDRGREELEARSRESYLTVVINGTGALATALSLAYLANHLTLHDVGLYSAVYVFWGIVRLLGPLGLDQLALRETAAAGGGGRDSLVSAFLLFAMARVTLSSVPVAIVTALVLTALNLTEFYVFSPAQIAVAAGSVPVFACLGVLAGQLRGLGRNIAVQSLEALGLSVLPVALLVLLGRLESLTLLSALCAQAFGAVFVLVAYLALRLSCGLDFRAQLPDPARRVLKREGLEIWHSLLVTVASLRAPTYISLLLLGPPATAILEIASRFGSLPTLFTSSVQTTFSAVFSVRHAEGDEDGLDAAVTAGSLLALAPAVVTLVGLGIAGPWLLERFFPPVYGEAHLAMLLICAAATVNAGCGLASVASVMTGRQRLVRRQSSLQLAWILTAGPVMALAFEVDGLAACLLIGACLRDIPLTFALYGRDKARGVPVPAAAPAFGSDVDAKRTIV